MHTPIADKTDTISSADEDERWNHVVYECADNGLWRNRLVLTPYMLLDRLKACADLAADSCAAARTPCERQRARQIEGELTHLLTLLWRSGLWADTESENRVDCDGRPFQVLAAPFTDGKPHGKPISPAAPPWQRDLLGLAPAGADGRNTPTLP